MDVIAGILTALGGVASIYAISTYRKDHVEKPNEERATLKITFKTNQRLAEEIRKNLVDYAETNNAYELQFTQGITFRAYIDLLNKTLDRDLSDSIFEGVMKEKLNESLIRSMQQSLDEQNKNLLQVRNFFDLYFSSAQSS